jgi:DNA helicase-2/ATP-dependent DNA helicase PcrA
MLEQLNQAQKSAVEQIDGPILILAGAGSGKTKTITTRLAYMIGVIGIPPENTLTLTFTNKAAQEMRNRAFELLGNRPSKMPLLCTFHKFGLLFLKRYINKLGRDKNFVIIDGDDKKRILRKILKEEKIDLNIQFIDSEISKYKNSMLTPQELLLRAELPDYKDAAVVYESYQSITKENNLVDFDDLLLLTYQILMEDNNLRKSISNQYQYIMVDEYQDTNELQYQILRALTSEHKNLCVVGDDDQSIYSWRGANIRNILEFQYHFPEAKLIKLELNYRSSSQILNVANSLIEHNRNRISKKLQSVKGDGPKVELLHSLDESLEAENIALRVKSLIKKGVDPEEIAILYRINALSRSIEDKFTSYKINFKLIGGIRFYERAEIKDIISYLRVIANLDDDFSLLRIINKPKRGIGKTSISKISNLAKLKDLSIFSLLETISKEELTTLVGQKNAKTLKEFVDTIKELKLKASFSLHRFLDLFEEKIDIKRYYFNFSDWEDRKRNIDEFIGFFRDKILRDNLTLEEFLNSISLDNEQDQLSSKAVNVMSIHASKGLEFEYVFIIGLEEEFFPVTGEGTDLEEERRLGYVAITRAKNNLTLCYCNSRFYKGRRRELKRSRFLGEAGLIKNTSLKLNKSSQYKKGDLVQHPIFGIGRVQAVTKSGKEYKLRINFGSTKKEILSSFVKPI